MSLNQQWLDRFRAVVDEEASKIDGKPASGYKAVADRTGLGYAYIYQIYAGKTKTGPSKQAMEKLEAAYGPVVHGLLGDGTPPPNMRLSEHELSPLAMTLGKTFDQIPEEDVLSRSIAFAQATQAIVQILEDRKAKSA